MVMKRIKPFVLEGGKTIAVNRKDRKTPSWAGMQNIHRTSLFIHLLRIAEARTKLYVTLAPTLFLLETYDATELYK